MATDCKDYEFSKIEPHWQKVWAENKTFEAKDFEDKPTFFVLDMFPYPSGAGLHIGHPEGYTASDILGRFKMANGYNVLHPMGWDAFGLPAEQHAIATGTHPAINTQNNINNFRGQIQRLGFGLDWDREINTTDPEYFKWTQWIFTKLFEKGLAYVDAKPVWWCPALGTVLANEEVIDGKSERGSHPVERRALRQWVLKITAYAEKLLDGLKDVDWPDSTKRMQEAWIGKSHGAEITFDIEGVEDTLTVFTTRPDTLHGATYMVVAPEHPILEKIVAPDRKDKVDTYIQEASKKSDLDRTDLAKEKTGVFSGAYAINPINGKKTPIWVADYVLISYGTGAIMAVPAHDERDNEFAVEFGIDIIEVIEPNKKGDDVKCFTGRGTLINSGEHTGLDSKDAKNAIIETLAKDNRGKATVNYKLRDWLFSRQRYWGEPFPILWVSPEDYAKISKDSELGKGLPEEPVTCTMNGKEFVGVALPTSQLPLQLPEVESYQPSGSGESPLANATEWLNVWVNPETGETISAIEPQPEGWISAQRETNTMPQWAGSCWYYLRYLDPKNADALVDSKIADYWGMPDFYIGGAEHAVLHLLYARFWHQFLYDLGVMKDPEPFKKLFHQGIILGEDGQKMSKSRGNVVNPDDIIRDYGADALRMYEMFLGPLEAIKPWSTKNIEGISRFLKKVWREIVDADGNLNSKIVEGEESKEIAKVLHETIKKVTEDIEVLGFNTAISQMMILVNALQKAETISKDTARALVQMVAPFAPHMGEELWERLGESGSVSFGAWPKFNPAKMVSDEVKIVFQVNGKVRGDSLLPKTMDKDEVLATAKASERVASFLEGKTIVKEIYVPGKIVNIVAK